LYSKNKNVNIKMQNYNAKIKNKNTCRNSISSPFFTLTFDF